MNGLPFNKYSWLTTHNSYAITGANSATGSILLSPKNQEDSITNQLKVYFNLDYIFDNFVLELFLAKIRL